MLTRQSWSNFCKNQIIFGQVQVNLDHNIVLFYLPFSFLNLIHYSSLYNNTNNIILSFIQQNSRKSRIFLSIRPGLYDQKWFAFVFLFLMSSFLQIERKPRKLFDALTDYGYLAGFRYSITLNLIININGIINPKVWYHDFMILKLMVAKK